MPVYFLLVLLLVHWFSSFSAILPSSFLFFLAQQTLLTCLLFFIQHRWPHHLSCWVSVCSWKLQTSSLFLMFSNQILSMTVMFAACFKYFITSTIRFHLFSNFFFLLLPCSLYLLLLCSFLCIFHKLLLFPFQDVHSISFLYLYQVH